MTAIARLMPSPSGDIIQVNLRLVIDSGLGLTVAEAQQRVRATFGFVNCPGLPSLRTHVSARIGGSGAVSASETFITRGRGGSRCRRESVRWGVSTDVVTLVDTPGRRGLDLLEHELGHALGIRHTYTPGSPMFHLGGATGGTRLCQSDVLEIVHQIGGLHHQLYTRAARLNSDRILRLPRGSVTPNSQTCP